MKETYTAPKVEIVEFDKKTDIICTSGEIPDNGYKLFGGASAANGGSTSFIDLTK